LVETKKKSIISYSEKEELKKYLMYELLIGLAKAKAYMQLKRNE
jgi:hypothetical protein